MKPARADTRTSPGSSVANSCSGVTPRNGRAVTQPGEYERPMPMSAQCLLFPEAEEVPTAQSDAMAFASISAVSGDLSALPAIRMKLNQSFWDNSTGSMIRPIAESAKAQLCHLARTDNSGRHARH
jgi:hypothetical protein